MSSVRTRREIQSCVISYKLEGCRLFFMFCSRLAFGFGGNGIYFTVFEFILSLCL